ncbi:TRAP transporter large permease [Marinomonas mediterranea]|jgi:TRAP-type C4-dicarboxylate transport system, large permease component|uniref:TRAP transporter large permease protein n=1 Tax=Marinomonas mediterranea (strain ATCC 700492 / JCM 21426 / NBRC 103028 / MMB-1) TaxID=717774 RepID=F2JXE0_MARM1|nr:TRAP transporter large permease [Marinomonas mediterranea]ADZ91840.1 TRAP C4-dicarboxylate transport system permease DctM subunit [Marinomonas mediterranea MMB-1]WCN09793.1 TRAP transporter large permease subunit [Marinomonas mediterranea]WCN13876.1 TRAP transporter large permease subunit [Marinomonas mediterranea]WCN17932.1 TRAP transporter large permease subunit [Marinomonas mediterranea MMB-1]
MTNIELAFVMMGLLLVLMSIRIPIAVSMMVCGAIGYSFIGGTPALMEYLGTSPVSKFSGYDLSVVPLFLLMGELATRSGITAELFKTCNTWIGRQRGGIAMAAVAGCAAFGAICGSSLATASTMGKVALPEMKRLKYSGSLAAGALAAGGTLGILIPPSMVLIIFAVLTEQNIAKMFIAAFIPGFLAAFGYIVAIAVYVRIYPDSGPRGEKTTFMQKLKSTKDVWHITGIFLVVLGGIYFGLFTPTEAAAVGVILTALLAITHGKMRTDGLLECLTRTAVSSAMIFFIVLGADLFSVFIALSKLPDMGVELISNSGLSPYTILVLMLLTYLVMGCFLDSLAMILLTIPIYFPMIISMDFGIPVEDLGIWFGILALIVVEVGLITPPVGMNVFIIKSFDKDLKLKECFKGVVPFLISDVVRVALLILFPSITLGLVHLIA